MHPEGSDGVRALSPRRIPQPAPGCDLRRLPLSPADAFLLSRVDGQTSEVDLAHLTGLGPEEVVRSLDRLVALGALVWLGSPDPAPRSAPRAPTAVESPDEPGLELEPEKRRRVRGLFEQLDRLTHYELLGVPRDADRKAIKSAYYALAPEFHPDRYFRKNLGPYRAMIEAVFARLTAAHDVLANRARRAEYDASLPAALPPGAMPPVGSPSAPAFPARSAPNPARPAPAPTPAPPPTPAELEALERRRREAFATRLRSSSQFRQVTEVAAPSSAPPPPSGDALRARYEAARGEAIRRQIDVHRAEAEAALGRGDPAAAASALRLAAALAPEDAELARACAEAQRAADVALAEAHLKEAEYEANQGRWGEAALAYAKACAGRPDDARAHERAAAALVRSGGNLRKAIALARRAVEISPKSLEARATLVRAYLAAGLEVSAKAEIERALAASPEDAKLRDVMAELQRTLKAPKLS